MKRLLLSILGGILLPIFYLATALFISYLLPQYRLVGDRSPGLLLIPVLFPMSIYITFIDPIGFLDAYSMFYRAAAAIAFFVAPVFILYTLLTYFLLWMFSFARKSKIVLLEPPPPPDWNQ